MGFFLRHFVGIPVATVIKLWVAEGFVKPSGSNCVEVLAMEYLIDLIDRNLIFVHQHNSREAPKYCGMHDLLKDLCTREAQKEKFLCVMNSPETFFIEESKNQRRLIINQRKVYLRRDSDDPNYPCDIIRAMPLIRSFVHDACVSTSFVRLISGLLKVLSVDGIDTNDFPVQVLELVNFRYLELGFVNQVPPSISRLWNLQTLIVRSFDDTTLPLEIWEMPQLRHLHIYDFYLPEVLNFQCRETDTSCFKGLQTLSNVINFRCTEEVLTRILYLKELKIKFSRDTTDWSFCCLNNLAHLCELKSLRCEFWRGPNKTIAQNIIFPSSLKKLVLLGSRIPWEKMTIIGMLPNLEILELKDGAFEGSLWEANDDEFRQLKFLLIEGSHDLKEWRAEDDHFPRLRHLLLRDCEALKAIPCGIGEIPTLEIIELEACRRSVVSSVKDMLGEDSEIQLKVSECRWV
ncbi:putative late blight resistance protein homolog R1A-3 [Primulina huaijiensis]|uniref:putative late blight resistance protein homolog R1A-3 n=1 Tax=Primulina huaijiensis TaxID=1492673 RepID=UPI003CC75A7D